LWEFGCIDPKLTGYNTSGQCKALDLLWKNLGFDDSKKPGEEEQKPEPPNFYKAWLLERERGILPEREERPEPVLSSPEPAPQPEPARIDRPAGLTQSSPARLVGNTMNRAVENQPWIERGAFGRFQR
jgi:hypothetical protein